MGHHQHKNVYRFTGTFYTGRSRIFYTNLQSEYLPVAVDIPARQVSSKRLSTSDAARMVRMYLTPSRSGYINYGDTDEIVLDSREWGPEFIKRANDGQCVIVQPPIFNLSGHGLNFYADYAGAELMIVPPHGVLNAARDIVEVTGKDGVVMYEQKHIPTTDGINMVSTLQSAYPMAMLVGSIISSGVYQGVVSPYPVMHPVEGLTGQKMAHINRFLTLAS